MIDFNKCCCCCLRCSYSTKWSWVVYKRLRSTHQYRKFLKLCRPDFFSCEVLKWIKSRNPSRSKFNLFCVRNSFFMNLVLIRSWFFIGFLYITTGRTIKAQVTIHIFTIYHNLDMQWKCPIISITFQRLKMSLYDI